MNIQKNTMLLTATDYGLLTPLLNVFDITSKLQAFDHREFCFHYLNNKAGALRIV